MMTRGLVLSAFSLILLGNAPDEQIPAALTPYVVEGELKIDDFGWMRGAFDGANKQQVADWKGVQSWIDQCSAESKAKAVAELKQLGIEKAGLDGVPPRSPICSSVTAFNAMTLPTKDWEKFVANEAKAREVFLLYRYGAWIASQHAPYEPEWGNQDAWKLLAATTLEQVYRTGFSWEAMNSATALDPAIRPYFSAHISNAVGKTDAKNTAFLKKLVQDKGWPTIPMVGKRASFNAWLLVQHADHDPAFQLQALRLMEPLAARGEVSKTNYAYLYDRVMLKFNGKQRFGTQFGGCEGDEYKLRPLEDEAKLEQLRAEYELGPMADYRKLMASNGPCRSN